MTHWKYDILQLLLAATLLLSACTGVEESPDGLPPTAESEPQAVAFSAYVNRSTTRGGTPGVVSTDALKTGDLVSDGFGVFAYYTESRLYNQLALPNFMYNEQVTWDGSAWTYSPVKYWPNGEGGSPTLTPHYVSFFAYAPYVDVAPTGTVDGTGITGLSRVSDNGDPMVRYCATMKPTDAVDLCWATPCLNDTKHSIGSPVTFNFRHALSALNVQIDADVDLTDHSHGTALDDNTRIYVRSITFEGFTDKGQLNLYSSTDHPVWNKLDCDCDLTASPYTLYDGRRDGKEGMAASLNERTTGLNPQLVQSDAYTLSPFASTTPGVTNTARNLFDVSNWTYANPASPTSAELTAALEAPVYVIPTNDPLLVTITYDVETYDPKLTSQYLSDGRTHGSTIENTITAIIENGSGDPIVMDAGKKYTIILHLGMASVKVNATVTPWEEGGSADVEVPKN